MALGQKSGGDNFNKLTWNIGIRWLKEYMQMVSEL